MKSPLPLHIAVATISLLLASCGLLPPSGSPNRAELRTVTPVHGDSRKLICHQSMVLMSQGDLTRNGKGLRLPAGIYLIEAQDSEYDYYRAPAKVEYRVVSNGKVDQRFIPGGIALPKRTFGTGAVYITDGPANQRMLTRALGGEFLGQEGKTWWERSER
ncbi:MAG: hypothetical protein EOP83_06750 [Verrucomicrobiaceae bacterium]|nr:MAG: hypothetical protein EOP83_06750 [Verrucomicrobiaceae bacterium]